MNEKEFVKIGEPSLFWSYFYKISNIPRCSGNEKRVREFVKEIAETHHFLTKIDKAGNLFVTNPNQKANTPTLILQSHLDMVCEKNEDIVHNFKEDPLKLLIIEQEGKKWITADGTTLGADDGIGMAYMLTIIQLIGSGKLKFDNLNLNFIFTVNEEGGMFGAYQIDENFLKGDYLINLDSESIDDFTIGCVGGNYTTFELDFSRSRFNSESELVHVHISIGGLKGGHAGVDINKNRGNSIKILSRILWNLRSNFQLYLGTINGGNSLNAIPREAFSEILIKKNDFSRFKQVFNEIVEKYKELYSKTEPLIDFKIEQSKEIYPQGYIDLKESSKIIDILFLLPNGVISMYNTFNDLVRTSVNLASVETKRSKIRIQILHRSFFQFENHEIYEKINCILNLSNLKFKLKLIGGYKEWKSNPQSKLLKVCSSTYKLLYDKYPNYKMIHGIVECGILNAKAPKLEIISLGCEVRGAHSPEEMVSIDGVFKMWNFLNEVLNSLNKS